MYFNDEHYEPNEYGDKVVRQESRIVEQRVNENVPSYFSLYLETNELTDNSDYLQLTSSK